jgi:hypothetical protein
MTNQEVLDVDQHSSSNRPVIVSNRTVVWSALPASGHGCYLAVFNRGDTTLDIALGWNEFGLPGTKYNLRDLWEHRDLGAAKLLKVTLQPHASRLLLLSDAL